MYVGNIPLVQLARSEPVTVLAPLPDISPRCQSGNTGWYITTVASDMTHGGSSIYQFNAERNRYELTSSLNDDDPYTVWTTGPDCYGQDGGGIYYMEQVSGQAKGLTMVRNGIPYGCAIDFRFGRDTVALEFFWCGT
jgi:hypothetical protein